MAITAIDPRRTGTGRAEAQGSTRRPSRCGRSTWTAGRVQAGHRLGPHTRAAGSRYHLHPGELQARRLVDRLCRGPAAPDPVGGDAAGITGVHEWTFNKVDSQTEVVTRESWAGAPVEADVAKALHDLDVSLGSRLAALRAEVERRRP